jgi:hypothetical protein
MCLSKNRLSTSKIHAFTVVTCCSFCSCLSMDYPCVTCNRHYGSKNALEQHKQNSPKHGDSLSSKKAPEQHQKDAPLSKETLYCKICRFYLSSKEIYEEHQQDLHTDKENFHCLICNVYFGSKGALEQHQRDSPRHKETFHCTTCNISFSSKEVFEQHQRDSHMHKETFHCQICGISFGSKGALEQHQRNSSMHKEVFQCKRCNRPFNSGTALRNHQRDCKVHQAYSEDYVDDSLDRRGDEASSSNARIRLPPVNIPALVRQFQAQSLASANPVATTPLPKKAKKAKRNVPEPTHETREFFMFPELHATIAEEILPEVTSTWFNGNADDYNYKNKYGTNVMGRFICSNNACKKPGWPSMKVCIEIRGYNNNGYSVVVYNQRCKSCNWLGTFMLDRESYIDRVAYRVKKWAGVIMTPPEFGGGTSPPHESKFCEGCKRGICQEGGGFSSY